jgi:signal transduction histidine kinase
MIYSGGRGMSSVLTRMKKEINIAYKLPLPDEDTVTSTDISKLTQVLTNLLNNAFQIHNRRGQLSVATRLINHFIEFYVSDTGIGIPEDQIARVFDRFYQVDYRIVACLSGNRDRPLNLQRLTLN